MLQFLFDTDHLTLYQGNHPPLMQRFVLHPAASVAICPISIEEIMRGRLAPLGRVLSGPKHVDAYARLLAATSSKQTCCIFAMARPPCVV